MLFLVETLGSRTCICKPPHKSRLAETLGSRTCVRSAQRPYLDTRLRSRRKRQRPYSEMAEVRFNRKIIWGENR